MTSTFDGPALCDALVAAALAAGADAADAIVATGESLSAEVRGGALELAERAEGVDLGVRALVGRRQAVVSASDASADVIAALAERAVAMARAAPEDPWCGLAEAGQLAPAALREAGALALDDPAGAPEAAALEALALRAEAAARGVAGVSQVEGAGAGWSRRETWLAASNGFRGGYARASATLSVSAIAGEGLGMERDYRFEARRAAADLPGPEEIGREAGERAVARLNPRRAPTGAWPVMFDERVASSLIGHLIGAANGASVARGSSWLKDRMGEAVLPKGLSVIEEPRRIAGPASRPFDAEGLATRETAFVRGGVLESWVLDLAAARQLGLESTANAMRGAGSAPSPGTTNLRLLAEAPVSRAEMLRSLGTGLLVTSMIGASINPNTGDYSRGAAGFWVEGGEIAFPVNEITVAGNLRRMLAGIVAADDAVPTRGAIVPSLMVPEGLTVAGG